MTDSSINSRMPKIIYGTAWKKEKTAQLVIQAIKFGFRGIDTACQPKHYHEAGVGEAIQTLLSQGLTRQELYIQTKFTPLGGQDPLTIPYDPKAPLNEQVSQSFEISKKNLGISDVDGLILHSPLENMNRLMTAWQAFEAIHHRGEAKRLGISNCYDLKTLKQLHEAATIKPNILQNRFYQATDYDREIRQWCHDNNVIYQSFWTLTANPHILENKIVQKAAEVYHKTAEQIFFRVLVDLGIVPLTGTCSEKHMQEDLEIMNFELPEAITREVSTLF